MSTPWTVGTGGRVLDGNGPSARTMAIAVSPELAEQIVREHNAHERLVRIENVALRIASASLHPEDGDDYLVLAPLMRELDAALEATS